ncbi:MAG: hypothetical protein AAGF12_07110 [Myxococcota bacterium]
MTRRTAHSTLQLILLGLTFAAIGQGCTATPLPEPPNFEPEINPEFVTTPSNGQFTRDIDIDVIGAPGAVEGGGSRIWILNLDAEESAPLERPVAVDGSFAARLRGTYGDVIRVELLPETSQGPIDLVTNLENASLLPARRPFADCLQANPRARFDFGDIAVGTTLPAPITIENACARLVFEQPRLKFGDAGFRVAQVDDARITIEFAPTSAGDAVDILFIETSGPSRDRIPITLRGRGF